jgi:hypothetical protein
LRHDRHVRTARTRIKPPQSRCLLRESEARRFGLGGASPAPTKEAARNAGLKASIYMAKRIRRGFALSFLITTGITGCSHGLLGSLTWVFSAC